MWLNLSLLITCTFLVSLTYRAWPVRPRRADHLWRMALAALTSVVLTIYSSPMGEYKFDLRFIPVILVTHRYGFWAGLLVALPAEALRVTDGRTAGLLSMGAALVIVACSAALRRFVNMDQFSWRNVLVMSAPLLVLGLLPPLLLPGHGLLTWVPAMLLNPLGLGLSFWILHTRLELLRVNNQLQGEVTTDALTGLGNRRRFDEELSRLSAGGQVVMLDVDHFRLLNEQHGFQVGDRALRHIGKLLADITPSSAFRLSNEEFALLFDNGSEEQVRAVVQEVQARLAEPGDWPWANLTISAGLATRGPQEKPSELVLRADKALFQAKTTGRNRLVVAQEQVKLPTLETPPAPLADLQPRYSLWQSQRVTLDLLSQRRHLTDQDWQELLRMAVESVQGAQAGSLNIREGRTFRLCAALGYGANLLGLQFTENSERAWYGLNAQDWLAGRPRILTRRELLPVWQATDAEHPPAYRDILNGAGRGLMRTNLCLPVSLHGEVIAHLNLESLTDERAFTPQSMQDAQVFGQQLGALLQLQERWRELDTLVQLNSELGLDDLLVEEHLVEAALELLRASYACLLRYDSQQDALVVSAARGEIGSMQSVVLPRGQGLSWQALLSGQVIRVDDRNSGQHSQQDAAPGLVSSAFMAVPLYSRTRSPLGVLALSRSIERPFQDADGNLTLMLASLGARVMERRAHLSDLRSTLEAALSTLGVALEARDFETQGHTQRVQQHALRMGQALNLPEEQMTALRHGAALHDIGKLRIPDAVLLKPGKLTPDERIIVEQHAPLGADIAARIPFLHPGAHGLIRHHHERWDGQGYPDRLAGEQTPLLARIFALCDVYDALISERPYKRALPPAEARQIIQDGSGTQFDPQLTALFLKVLDQTDDSAVKPVGVQWGSELNPRTA